jgi:hypothetical protein
MFVWPISEDTLSSCCSIWIVIRLLLHRNSKSENKQRVGTAQVRLSLLFLVVSTQYELPFHICTITLVTTVTWWSRQVIDSSIQFCSRCCSLTSQDQVLLNYILWFCKSYSV